MSNYFNRVCNELTSLGAQFEPVHLGIVAAVVVVMGYFLLRGFNLSPR